MMPGPSWYTKGVFDGTLNIPAKEMTAVAPLLWGSADHGHDRPGWWRTMDHLQALLEHQHGR